MLKKREIIEAISPIKEEIFRKYKVKKIGIFGSLVRGEAQENSDIDVLVQFKENADLFDFLGLALFLEEKLHHKIDIVPERALRSELKDFILKEVAYI